MGTILAEPVLAADEIGADLFDLFRLTVLRNVDHPGGDPLGCAPLVDVVPLVCNTDVSVFAV